MRKYFSAKMPLGRTALFTVVVIVLMTAELAGASEVEPDADAPTSEFDPFVVYDWAADGSECDISPELLAAVGRVASNHGDLESYSFAKDGTLEPPLYGERGDGARLNLATLQDSDFGAIDADVFWDRPVGPFQILPVSWHFHGLDGNADGSIDPQNLWDASASAANFLCQKGAGTGGDEDAAIRIYTGSDKLRDLVLEHYEEYRSTPAQVNAVVPVVEADDEESDDANEPDETEFEEADDLSETQSDETDDADEPERQLEVSLSSGEELVGDWNGDGTKTEATWVIDDQLFVFRSATAKVIPLDSNGRPYGAQIHIGDALQTTPLVGDWNDDGFDSIAIRRELDDDTHVVEFFDRFARIEMETIFIEPDDDLDAIWAALRGDEPEAGTEFGGDSHGEIEAVVDTHSGEQIELVRVQGILVNITIADNVDAMLDAARADGLELTGWGWRSHERQIELRTANCADPFETPSSQCSPPTATPGNSRHEFGLAIDFHVDGVAISRSTPEFGWLSENAATFGLFNLPSEAWHWSDNGR